MIFSLEKRVFPTLLLGLLDLEQIGIHEIAYVILIEGRFVLIDGLLEEIGHLLPILRDLVLNTLDARQIAHQRYVIDGRDSAEKLEALLDEAHEPLESRIPMLETHSHDDRADHIADRHCERGRDIRRRPAAQLQPPQKRIYLTLNLKNHDRLFEGMLIEAFANFSAVLKEVHRDDQGTSDG